MTPTSAPASRGIARYLPAGRAWWLVAGAVLAGLLLFALVLSGKRDEFEFYRAGGEPGSVPGQVFDPLPAPLPAGESAASGMETDQPPPAQAPRIDQHGTPAATTAAQPPQPAPAPVTETASSQPRLVSSPAPEYPAAALRAGLSGEVVLRIDVGADGRPDRIEVASSSRHRALDQAAIRAVRRWRFEPAMRDGVAVPGTVQQSIRFDAPR